MIMIIIMIMIALSIYGEGKPLCTHPCQDRRTHPEGWPSSRSCTWPAVMIIRPRFDDLILRNWPSRSGHWGQGCWLQKIGKASLLVSFVNKQVFAKCESWVTHHCWREGCSIIRNQLCSAALILWLLIYVLCSCICLHCIRTGISTIVILSDSLLHGYNRYHLTLICRLKYYWVLGSTTTTRWLFCSTLLLDLSLSPCL